MDETPPTVFKPNDSEREYAVVLDPGDAITLERVLKKEALRTSRRLRNSTQGHAVRRNQHELAVLTKYAERFKHVRKAETADFVRRMQEKSSQD